MAYRYLAYNEQGEAVSGELDLPSEDAVERYLWRRNLTVVQVQRARRLPALDELLPTFLGVSTQQVIIFSRRLAILLQAGIPLFQAVRILAEDPGSRALQRVLERMQEELQEGRSLAQTLRRWPHVFPTLYVELVRVGEETGQLDEVIHQAAAYLERELELRRKIQGALVYPALILALAAGVVAILTTVTLPRLTGILASLNVPLPLPTRLLIGFTEFVNRNLSNLVVAFGGALLLVGLYFRTRQGTRVKDRLLLSLPLVRTAVLMGNLSRISRASALLLSAGHPLPEVLRIAQEVSTNVHLRDAFGRVRQGLIRGEGLADPMSQEPLFPNMYVQMIRVGEETGNLEANLVYMADFHEDEVNRAVAALTGALEPALVIFVGGVVVFVALSIIMPIYGLLGGF